ncbi:MAG: S-layer homology domain-containing protein [Lachnospiraceae bacterium]|nr:S-layer homology domain-containing protein [Lachnospiraceae bacterium]
MKRILSLIIIISIVLSSSFAVFANSSDWATGNIEKALSLNIISQDMVSKSKENVTRLQFCNVAFNFYKVYTGNSGITLIDSPFFDVNNPIVNKCYELGIVSGIGNNLFGPNSYITREQMASLLIATLNACGVEIDYTLNTSSLNSNFKDLSDIESDSVKDVKILAFENVISGYNGYFYPKAYVTVEQLATAFVKTYEVFKSYGLNVDGNLISIGDEVESVIEKFGEPDRIDKSIYNTDRYIYNSDYEKFLMVSFENGKVSDIFSNAPSLSYKGVDANTSINDFSMFIPTTLSNYNEMKIYNYNMETKLYFDYENGYKLDAVYIRDTRFSASGSYNVMIASYTEKELLDIINVFRYKNGLSSLSYDASAYQSAKNYSAYMRENESFSYVDLENRSPFDRMKISGIDYSIAAENITYITGDSISIYHDFIKSTATKSNILIPDLTYAGIGCTITGNKIYTVLDMFAQ